MLPDVLTAQEERAWHLYAVRRWTQHAIADDLGVSQQRISQLLARVRERLPKPDLGEMRQQAVDLYADIVRRSYALAELEGAPVTAGKDGDVVVDPESGDVVRDYGARLAALRLAKDAEAELRKLMGLDAASKVESTATVRYEVHGVDTSKLT